jgi:hypothetical protein
MRRVRADTSSSRLLAGSRQEPILARDPRERAQASRLERLIWSEPIGRIRPHRTFNRARGPIGSSPSPSRPLPQAEPPPAPRAPPAGWRPAGGCAPGRDWCVVEAAGVDRRWDDAAWAAFVARLAGPGAPLVPTETRVLGRAGEGFASGRLSRVAT